MLAFSLYDILYGKSKNMIALFSKKKEVYKKKEICAPDEFKGSNLPSINSFLGAVNGTFRKVKL